MVPSTGLRTAWNETSTAFSNALFKASVETERSSGAPSHRPRRICDVMTPELPRAPMSAPVVMAWRTSAGEAPSGSFFKLFTTDSSVSDMFVPVSPSGTGNTLSRLTSSLRADRFSLAALMALSRSLTVNSVIVLIFLIRGARLPGSRGLRGPRWLLAHFHVLHVHFNRIDGDPRLLLERE